MWKYQRLAIQMDNHFNQIKFVQVLREENLEADEVAQIASSKQRTQDEVLTKPSIKEIQALQVEPKGTWMTPILSYIQEGKLPKDPNEVRRTRVCSARFAILNGQLYKQG